MGLGRDTGSHNFWLAVIVLAATISSGSFHASGADPAQPPISFENVRQMARALAGKEFRPAVHEDMPEFLRKMGYDEYNLIRFWPNAWPWQTGPIQFGVQCFHRA